MRITVGTLQIVQLVVGYAITFVNVLNMFSPSSRVYEATLNIIIHPPLTVSVAHLPLSLHSFQCHRPPSLHTRKPHSKGWFTWHYCDIGHFCYFSLEHMLLVVIFTLRKNVGISHLVHYSYLPSPFGHSEGIPVTCKVCNYNLSLVQSYAGYMSC